MKLLRVWLVITLILVNLLPIVVLADSSVDVVISADPALTAGITSFTITYISETQIDLDWTVDPTVDKVMIRAKYGEYPDDIPNENIAPSDGYLVYYGFDFSTTDTSMDFDSNLGTLYYKAWAQKPDGKWYVDTYTGFKESEVVALILLFGTGLVISGYAIAKKQTTIAIVASAIWLACIAYTRANPIGTMTTGDTADTAILLALIALMILVPIISFRLNRREQAQEAKEDGYKQASLPRNRKSIRDVGKFNNRQETSDEYYERLYELTHNKR